MRVMSSPASYLLSHYLRGEFLRLFCLCLLTFLCLYLIVDFFDRFDTFLKHTAPTLTIVRYFLFKLPLIVTQMVPAAVLTGSLLSLGLLARRNELTALFACGVSLWQIARPLLGTAALLSLGTLVWNETIVPYCFHQSRHISTVEIKKKAFKGLFHEKGFWYHGNKAFYHIDHFDSRQQVLFGLTIYTLDDNFQVRSLIRVPAARWQEEGWHLDRAEETLFTSDGQVTIRSLGANGISLSETPEDFALVEGVAEEFSYWQLRVYIQSLQRRGLSTTEYQVDLHLKLALPCTAMAMALIGIALAVSSRKRLGLATAFSLALTVGFGYWVVLALAVSLGHSGSLHPLIAAWVSNVIATLLGMFFFLGAD
jgi:lipopolysaccharide export system permease protein